MSRNTTSGNATSGNGGALASLALFALATALVSLVVVNGLKDAAVYASLRGQPIGLDTVRAAIGPLEIAVLAFAGLVTAALAWFELRDRRFTALLRTATPAQGACLMLVLVAWTGHAYLGRGVLLGGDTGTHIARFLEVARGLEGGRLPTWTNYQFTGAPLLWFTGPFTYVVGGALAWALGSAVVAAKAILFGMHLVAGWAFYAWLRRLALGPSSAALAAALFSGCFAILHLFLYRGVFPQAFTLVFLVLLFMGADGLMRGVGAGPEKPRVGARWGNALLVGLSTAGLIVNHQPHALFAAFYLALFGAACLATGVWRWRGAPVLVLFGVLGAVASAVAVLPVLVESDWVMIEPEGGFFRAHLPTAQRLLNLVLWRNTRTTWGIDYWAYLGLGLLAFSLWGFIAAARGRGRDSVAGRMVLPAAICLLPCLVLYNPVVRDVMFIALFLGLVAAFGIERALTTRGQGAIFLVIFAMADLASTAVQPVARTDKRFLVDAGRALEAASPPARFLQLDVPAGEKPGPYLANSGPDGGPMSYEATPQRIAGNHDLAAPRVHNLVTSVAKQAEYELQATGRLTPTTRTLLGAYDVARIVCTSSIAMGCPPAIEGTRPEPGLGPVLPIPAAPVLFAPALMQVELPPGTEKPMLKPEDYTEAQGRPRIEAIAAALARLAEDARFDIPARHARAIPVLEAPPAASGAEGSLEVLGYTVGLERVELRLRATSPGFVQVSHPWFPSTLVLVNGAAVQPMRGALGLIVLPVAAGETTIVLDDGPTRVRTLSAVLSLAGLLAILGGAAWVARRDHGWDRAV